MLKTTNRDLHAAAAENARELDARRTQLAALVKRSKDTALVASSGGTDVRAALEAMRAAVADLTARRDFAESDNRVMRATAGQTAASIRNLYCRVVWTAPPTALPTVIVNGRAIPPPPYVKPSALGSAAAAGAGGAGAAAAALGATGAIGAGFADGGSTGRGTEAFAGGTTARSAATVSTAAGAAGAGGAGGPPGTPASVSAAGGSSSASGSGGVIASVMTNAADASAYLSQCLDIIGDRIGDIEAIVAEYP